MRNKTDFIKLVRYLKKKHNMWQWEVAECLEISEKTVSAHMRKANRCTGAKHVPALKALIDKLEGKEIQQSEPLFYCSKCNNAHKYHPEKGSCYS